jgi:tetratricopeptide (TPR) repeat protein
MMPLEQSKLPGRLLPIFIALLTVAVFLPVLHNGFVGFADDDNNLLRNTNYRGLGWTEIRWMFTTLYMTLYRPLAWLTYGFDYMVWGLNPAGFHATSLIFHAANSALVYAIAAILYRLAQGNEAVRRVPRVQFAAALAALLFALHPMTAETVAWASARGDVVAALFIFASVYLYLRAAESLSSRRWLLAAWLCYALSLLSKAAGISYPIVLAALDIYPLRRFAEAPKTKWSGPQARRIWLEKLPFLALSVAAALVAVIGKTGYISEYRPWLNVTRSAYSLLFYLGKMALPRDFSIIYPVPTPAELARWPIAAYPLIILAITIAAVLTRRRCPGLAVLWASYVAWLLPVSGIVKYGYQLVSDRYAYLPLAMCAIGFGALTLSLWESSWRSAVFASAVTAALVVLSLMTWDQTQIWHDPERLFRRAIAVAPRSALAHRYLAAALMNEGRPNEAVNHYRHALAIADYPEGHLELADALSLEGQTDAAAAEYRAAIRSDPLFLDAWQSLGAMLVRHGRIDEAIAEYREAVKTEPAFVEGHNNLGLLLASRGKIDDAIREYRDAIRLKPDFALAHANLGDALLLQRNVPEAMTELETAVKLDPSSSAQRSLEKARAALREDSAKR